jgi:hypothetical protein
MKKTGTTAGNDSGEMEKTGQLQEMIQKSYKRQGLLQEKNDS